MAKINVLDSQCANMIAAGEVVDRPASAVKELVENAIDAGATTVSVEVRNGGITLIRVTDNGSGMLREDLPKCILRHATSKISRGNDLENITTLGFRGEALAAIAAVSELQIVTRTAEEPYGSLLESNGEGVSFSEVGCPVGTTVVVRNLFYNTPARRKFLKRDSTEAAACRTAVEKEALGHPNVAFKFISDGELKLSTPGNSKVFDTIAEIAGTELAKNLMPVKSETDSATVRGYVCKPAYAKGRNNSQNCFVNGRFVVSKTAQAATKAAYQSYMPNDRYPVTYLYIDVPPDTVDVNVHPAKTEIKFSKEQAVYETVYFAVRGALERADAFTDEPAPMAPPPVHTPPMAEPVTFTSAAEPKSIGIIRDNGTFAAFPMPAPESYGNVLAEPPAENAAPAGPLDFSDLKGRTAEFYDNYFKPQSEPEGFDDMVPDIGTQTAISDEPEYRYVGELYNSFIIAETENAVYVVDKHAAHERILYEELKREAKIYSQILLVPKRLQLDAQTLDIIY